MTVTEDDGILIRPIAHIHTDFPEKFGLPRQSGMVEGLEGRIIFMPEYRRVEAFRELETFSHLWLIWQFSQAVAAGWHMTVRPPRLGGNKRVGVFASRSPFRPNNLGLSCVKLERVDYAAAEAPVLIVSGIDMLDGTPLFDVKPYIPMADCHPEAEQGYTAHTRLHELAVEIPEPLLALIPADKRPALTGVLAYDPRPGYEDDPDKEYGMTFAGLEIGFKVAGQRLQVCRVKPGPPRAE